METIQNKSDAALSDGCMREDDSVSLKNKNKNRGRKRKRKNSDCSSSEEHEAFPENTLEMEKNLQASAIKNNLDDVSMKKILKKVVTNDHVLALVKLREEEEIRTAEKSLQPKLTRAKAKELMKVSPKTAPWNIALTPIKHIPVKTRPEVKALIAQELPEDEDDEEYKPTQDDVPSDDDQTIESCSDLDSQPRTPATPNSQCTPSPKVLTDGPFKVPQVISSAARRKLDLEEEATIALRTRSKLCLSTTSIEHIESSFNPPDDLPTPIVDDLWNQFLVECLNPGPATKNEDDDETDPEYSVAADPDANEEDEEALENSIIKISKKELNDLMTELFELVPESTADKIAESLVSDGIIPNTTNEQVVWEGKQEPLSDDENQNKRGRRITFEKDNIIRFSVGKTETEHFDETETTIPESPLCDRNAVMAEREKIAKNMVTSTPKAVEMTIDERHIVQIRNPDPPPLLRMRPEIFKNSTNIEVDVNVQILPEQILILQQQLRQHIQLATSNFLQLCVNPVHWALAPQYKEYLEIFEKMLDSNPNSVVNVCNLRPACELVISWEKSVSKDTPENAQMVKFMQGEAERCRRRVACNSTYVGSFHETFMNTVANSAVFLYPYLLPALPFRPDHPRKCGFMPSEDAIIALGLDQFWDYVEENPQIYKPPAKRHPRQRWGYSYTIELINKHILPWMTTKTLMSHINHVKKKSGPENPINKWFANRATEPVDHKILPISPNITLYEQPEDEMPKIWVRYLAKTSKRFRKYLYRRSHATVPSKGVPININCPVSVPNKNPLPIDFTKPIDSNRINIRPKVTEIITNRLDINIATTPSTTNVYNVIQTDAGSFLIPVTVLATNTVDSTITPITSAVEKQPIPILPKPKNVLKEHCPCCDLLRKMYKIRQTTIMEFFNPKSVVKRCPCKSRKPERVTNRLKLLVLYYNKHNKLLINSIQKKIEDLSRKTQVSLTEDKSRLDEDKDVVSMFHQRLTMRIVSTRDSSIRKKFHSCINRFNPDTDDPIKLAKEVEDIFNVELVDTFKEFLSFLTPEQAVKIDKFKDYFVYNCIKDLVKKIEEHISSKEIKEQLFNYFKSIIENKLTFENECDVCCDILTKVSGHPQLAEYVFSLFPHNRRLVVQTPSSNAAEICKSTETQDEPNQNDTLVSKCDQAPTLADYEADHSSSGEDENELQLEDDTIEPPDNIESVTIKMESVSPPQENGQSDKTNDLIECKEEEDSDISMHIFIDEDVKTEEPEWKREEDKLILEVLKEKITPQERKDKTILEILEDNNVISEICESLTHKSMEEVKERVKLILQMFVIMENKS